VQSWLESISEFFRFLGVALDGPALFLVALADSSFLSIPEGNDILIVVLSTDKSWSDMAYYVLMTILGSVTGCLLLYSLGRKGGSPLLRKRFSAAHIARAEAMYRRYGLLTVLVSSILPPPCPFKIFVLSAGVFRMRTVNFVVSILIGRTLRYSMWGILAVLYGGAVKAYIQTNLARTGLAVFLAFLLFVALILGFHWVRYRRKRQTPAQDG